MIINHFQGDALEATGELLYWDKSLTDAELAEQLAYTRKFMLNARGVTLP